MLSTAERVKRLWPASSYWQRVGIENARLIAAEKNALLVRAERCPKQGSRRHELFDGVALHFSFGKEGKPHHNN